MHGKVTLVSPALDPNRTTVEIWVQAPNTKGQLKPGGGATVTVVTETVPHAIVIPDRSPFDRFGWPDFRDGARYRQ